MAAPSAQTRSDLDKVLGNLIKAIEQHELWTPPKPHPTLYYVWDFVKRSKYMLSEYENIQNGRALQYPDQIRPSPGTGDEAALKVFNDVCSRTMMTMIVITDTSGKTTLMTGASGSPLDFGRRCKEMVEELVRVTPSENMTL